MKFYATPLLFVILFSMAISCSKKGSSSTVQLPTEKDSVDYVIGMNLARTLHSTDSMVNYEAVCAGIRDYFLQKERWSYEDARQIYLHHIYISKPEQVLAYENQFLEEIANSNRAYARSKTGLTYAVESVGDVEKTPRNSSDTVTIRWIGKTIDNREFYSSFERKDSTRTALGDLPEGVQEALKLIGEGGHINAWLPAKLAYGAEGNKEWDVKPNSTLYFEIDLVELQRRGQRR